MATDERENPAGEAATEQVEGMPSEGEQEKTVEAGQVQETESAGEGESQGPDLAQIASDLGLDAEALSGMTKDPAQIAAFLDTRLAAMGASLLGPPQQQRATPAAAKPVQATQTGEVPATQVADAAAFKLEIDEDSLDEHTVKVFRAMEGAHNAALQQVRQLSEAVNAMSQASQVQQFDSFLTGLPQEYSEMFGTGPTADLKPHSKHLEARMEVWSMMDALAAGCQAMNMPVSSRGLFERALRAVTSTDFIKRSARKEIASKMKARSTQQIGGGATATQKAAPPSLEKAKQTAARKMEQMGLDEA